MVVQFEDYKEKQPVVPEQDSSLWLRLQEQLEEEEQEKEKEKAEDNNNININNNNNNNQHPKSTHDDNNKPPTDVPLPFGWEMRMDNAVGLYFIDHNTRTTTYEDPRTKAPTPSLPPKVEETKTIAPKPVAAPVAVVQQREEERKAKQPR